MSTLAWRILDRLAHPAPASPPSALETEVCLLFEELRSPLLRFTCSLGISPADGEDVVQEVFLSLFRHLSEGKPRDNLRGWIFRVARNLALKRRLRLERLPEGIGEDCNVADQGLNPEQHAEFETRSRRLLSVVHALSERDRACLSLRAEGLRYREIAEALDMSLGAVAASLTRSLAKLATVDRR